MRFIFVICDELNCQNKGREREDESGSVFRFQNKYRSCFSLIIFICKNKLQFMVIIL